jgi:hypothetical protein
MAAAPSNVRSSIPQGGPRPQNTRAIMAFLREQAPFSHMDDAHLAHFAENASLRFYADGDVVLSPDAGPVKQFYVVKTVKRKQPSKSAPVNAFPWQP